MVDAMLGVHAWWCAPVGRKSGQVVVAQCDRRSIRESGTYKQLSGCRQQDVH